ncbi:hypothetical protein E2C01_078766 [Portunus trituberculatus]|uniref:Uncharacterized protein n=1 Tax=Portunus trituberculatus TaxID=210409 RepID=A0A5B7IF75_PORTR|nr:hypothetical protein [Portunus trituberculatus]
MGEEEGYFICTNIQNSINEKLQKYIELIQEEKKSETITARGHQHCSDPDLCLQAGQDKTPPSARRGPQPVSPHRFSGDTNPDPIPSYGL